MKFSRKQFLGTAVAVGVMWVPALNTGAEGQKKVVICHKGTTLEVAEPAVLQLAQEALDLK